MAFMSCPLGTQVLFLPTDGSLTSVERLAVSEHHKCVHSSQELLLLFVMGLINRSCSLCLFSFIKHNYMQPDCTLFDAKWERIIFPVVQCNNMLSLAVNENHN